MTPTTRYPTRSHLARRAVIGLGVALLALAVAASTATLAAAKTKRVSVHSNGDEADGWSENPSISKNGRYVAFNSHATNLVDNDTNGVGDVFVHDRKTGKTERVSERSNGDEGNDSSYFASISGNGRTVAFLSRATNLVNNDTNDTRDVFQRRVVER